MTLLSDADRDLIDGLRAGVCTGEGPCDTSPFSASTTDNWVARVGGLPLYMRAVAKALVEQGKSESEAIATAVATMKRWAAGGGNVTAATRARAAKALAEWEAKKSASHGKRDAGGVVTEGGSAGSLLPVGPSPKIAARVEAKLALADSDGRHPDATTPHAFRGRDLTHCAKCGQPASAPIHHTRRAATGSRHAGPGHAPVATGHIKDNPVRRRVAHKKAFVADAERLEPHLHAAMAGLVDRQAKATLSRLTGNRGKRMLRAAQPPASPEGEPGGTQPPAAGQPTPDAQAIFDLAFWAEQTASAAQPIIDQAGQVSVARVNDMLGLAEPVTSSLDGVDQALQARANRLAGQVTDTTFAQIQQALADGIDHGEGIQQLADRVRHVFDVARSRAELIARTEVGSAMNTAASAYVKSLPPGTVSRKEWLAVHDTRTRMTHRQADGQSVPVSMPFVVGGWLMDHPGDPEAPADEVCNCRCTVLYHPGTPVTGGGQSVLAA